MSLGTFTTCAISSWLYISLLYFDADGYARFGDMAR